VRVDESSLKFRGGEGVFGGGRVRGEDASEITVSLPPYLKLNLQFKASRYLV